MPRRPAQSSSGLLREYRAKRNFTKTPEPSGTASSQSRQRSRSRVRALTFCVQKHLATNLHYDFRLEHRGVLLSWAVPKGPSLNPADKRLAMKVEDHPLEYGKFEGVIPEGYGAGIVMLWDRGTWAPLGDDIDAALKNGQLKFELHGVKLKGSWVLVRTGGSDSRTWLLIKHRDEWAGNLDITKFAPLSVTSFGDFEDILAKDKPDVWLSSKPARGGQAGAMLRKIISRVEKLAAKEKPTSKSRAGQKKASRTRPSTRKKKAARARTARPTFGIAHKEWP